MPFSRSRRTDSAWHRKYPVIGQVVDYYNDLWDVREARDTKHGFEILYGSPVYRLANGRCGPPRCFITTRELVAYWEANKTKHDGVLFDLPAGRTTLKRARARLGFHYLHDVNSYWTKHLHDLKTLTPRRSPPVTTWISALHSRDVATSSARWPGPWTGGARPKRLPSCDLISP